MTPTQAQIEAARQAILRLREASHAVSNGELAEAALTAAAQVGEQGPYITWETLDRLEKKMEGIEAATIERCAQHLAERGWIEAAGELRKLKDEA